MTTFNAINFSPRYEPTTEAARALTAAIFETITPHLGLTRALGVASRASRMADLGVVLAGILREALQGHVVNVRASKRSPVWRGSPVKHDRFWTLINAMEAAGLVTLVKGKSSGLSFPGGPVYRGLPGRLSATEAMLDVAAMHGVTRDTRHDDWQLSAKAKETPRSVLQANAVQIGPWILGRPQEPPTAAQMAAIEAMRIDVAAINDAVAAAEITGCAPPTFIRRFQANLRLGGRLYDGDGYQTMKSDRRAAITINGETTVEIDIRACNLSIFLALCGHQVTGDPYALPTLPNAPRTALKAWFRQSFGSGRAAGRWSPDVSIKDRCDLKATVIREAALAAYPSLGNMLAVVPTEVTEGLPTDRHRSKAVGRYLEFLESEIMIGAIRDLLAAGVTTLPMHDGLIAPAHATHMAMEAVTASSMRVLGMPLMVVAEAAGPNAVS